MQLSIAQQLAHEIKRRSPRSRPTHHLLVFAASQNTYLKQAVHQLSRGGEFFLLCENFTITVAISDSPIVSERD